MIDWRDDPFPHLIGDGIACFRDPADTHLPALATPALLHPPRPVGPVPTEFRMRPRFGAGAAEGDPSGTRVVRLAVPRGTGLYGTGEVAGPLRRNGCTTTCWNTDSFEYDDTTPRLYQSHPWVLGVRADGSAFGVLADTASKCEIRTGSTSDGAGECDIEFAVPRAAAPFAVYIIERDSPEQVVAALADLTGHMPMPPKWALGYHQSRWSYFPDERVRTLAKEFRTRSIPCDVIWMDIDYMEGFRCFTFDRERFPDPAALNEHLHGQGFKTVWMIDPGIKVDPDYSVYAEGNKGGHFLQNAAGGEYHGKVWPGACAFPDFTQAATRTWWAGLYSAFMARGIDGVWNDMNEPAIFDNDAKQMPEDNHHRADAALGGPGPHSRYHNLYGMLMVRASREGIAAARPEKRPFVLTRSNFIGGHRYAATWTGDNQSDWDHLEWSIPMALNLGLSGQPFSGPDIGGFSGNADPKLFARWMGIGALLPFARGHSINVSTDHEPWAFGPECEATCRRALERRYRLLPYLYTLFYAASRTGIPIVRPVFFADTTNADLRDVDDCFLLGGDVLVRCAVEEATTDCGSPFPAGDWRSFEPCPMAGRGRDPELPDLRFRAGSIVPLGPVMQHVDAAPLDPLTLVVCPDTRGEAHGTLYEDLGDGHEHENGLFRVSAYTARRKSDHLVIRLADQQGRMHRHGRGIEVVVLLEGGVIHLGRGSEGHPIHVKL